MADEKSAPDDDIARADAAARAESMDVLVRGWLHGRQNATLCTLSVRKGLEGWPFGSVAPFALDERGHPYVLIAGIAAHTANLKADPRASLFVYDDEASEDPQASWRICLMGRFTRVVEAGERDAATAPSSGARTRSVTTDEHRALVARYRERVPSASTYLATHDFHFWVLDEIATVRTIAGFGKITWLDGDVVARAPSAAFIEAARGAVAHMNADHAATLVEIVRGLTGHAPARATLVSIDRGGLLIEDDTGALLHASFAAPLDDETQIRKAVIEVLTRARGARS